MVDEAWEIDSADPRVLRNSRSTSNKTAVLAGNFSLGFHRRKKPHHDDFRSGGRSTLCCARGKQ